MSVRISDNDLLQALLADGAVRLSGEEFDRLAEYLEARAVETGLAAPLFTSQTVRAIVGLLREHESAGGVRIGFLRGLDQILQTHLPLIQGGDPLEATSRARTLRDEVRKAIDSYDPQRPYE